MSKKDPGASIVTGASRCTVAAVAERPAADAYGLREASKRIRLEDLLSPRMN
jgi:hypothetical protein